MEVPDSPSMRKFLESSRRSESGSDTGQVSPSVKLGPQVTVEWSTTVQSPRRSTQEQGMNATSTPAPSSQIASHSPHAQPDPKRQDGGNPPSPSSLPFAPQSPPSEPLSLTIPGPAKISLSPAGGSPKYSLVPPSSPSAPPPQIAISAAHSPHHQLPVLQSPTHSHAPDASPPAAHQGHPLAGSLSPLGTPPSLLYTPQSEVMVFQPSALANASVGSPVGSPQQQPSLGSPRQEPEHTVAVNLSEMWSILTETVKRVEHLEARQDGMDLQIMGVQEAEKRLTDLVLTVEELGKVQSARNRALALQNSPLEDELLASRFGAGLEQLRYQIRQLEHDSEGSRLELRTSIRELFRALESSPRGGGGGMGVGMESSYSPSKYSGGAPGGPGEMDIASAKKRVMDALQDPGSRGIETHVKPEWDDPNLLTLSKNDVNKLNRLVERVNTVEERLRQSRGDERRNLADGKYASTVDRHALERAVTEEMGRRMGEMRREWEKWAEALKVGIDSRLSDALDPNRASGSIFK